MKDLDGLTVEEQRDYWRDLCHERSMMMGAAITLLHRIVPPAESFVWGEHPDDYRDARMEADNVLDDIKTFLEGK